MRANSFDIHSLSVCPGVDFRRHEAFFEDVAQNVEADGSKGLAADVIPGQDTQRTASGVKLQTVPYDLIVGADGETFLLYSFRPAPTWVLARMSL